ncbi:MAG: circularly permuted type 2 ATP-grasp protein [Myxococcota bacterium]
MAASKGSRADSVGRKLFEGYAPLDDTWDEFFAGQGQEAVRPAAQRVADHLNALSRADFRRLKRLADDTFLRSGITFTLYDEKGSTERIFPFDLIPRVIDAREWETVREGIVQRIRALNCFLADVYGAQRILEEGVVPRFLVEGSKAFRPELMGIRPPKDVWVHIAGVDLIRDGEGRFVVLEDNLRVPSGVSYVLENRETMKKTYPEVFRDSQVAAVESYPHKLREAMNAVAPGEGGRKRMAVLTPGPYNSAYFEHSYLARRIGCALVQGSDLFVDRDRVYARTTNGPTPIDAIYRRVDDDFLDPKVFRSDSLMGVEGLIGAWAAGNVAIVNAVGNGVADDKGIYPFVPDMIRFYLDEEILLPQVETRVCAREDDCRQVLDHLDEYVVKSVNEAGGYGMLMGPSASKRQLKEFRKRIEADPRNFIAQPRIELSSCPTWTSKGVEPRRVDLRPFAVTGDDTWVLPGGLTRVALRKGSYVVNSSQGGGSKDTWVVEAGR